MIQLIAGQNGKGKTTEILNKANEEVKSASGNIVFIDKNNEHMYELNNRIRMINVSDFSIESSDEFTGFISGMISQNRDIQTIYLDRFMKCAKIADAAKACEVLQKLEKISNTFEINLVVSISVDKNDLPADLQEKVIVAL